MYKYANQLISMCYNYASSANDVINCSSITYRFYLNHLLEKWKFSSVQPIKDSHKNKGKNDSNVLSLMMQNNKKQGEKRSGGQSCPQYRMICF